MRAIVVVSIFLSAGSGHARPESISAKWLSDKCPAGFTTVDGACFYSSAYVTGSARGLARGFEPDRNGLDPRMISLGKLLFFDPILSAGQDISCAHCHQPQKGFADGQAHRHGRLGAPLRRSAPTIWNTAFRKQWFWDGRASSLEEQVLGPLTSPDEMGATADMVEKRLNGNDTYQKLFAAVFATPAVTIDQVQKSIAAFERTLVSLDSPWDRYAMGDHTALTHSQIEGLNVFRSFVARCPECHTPPLFLNHQFAVLGVPPTPGIDDHGLGTLLRDKNFDGAFMVPTLRNIARTAPYMHNGSLKTLQEVVEFYNEGGGHGDRGRKMKRIHWHIRPMGLTAREVNLVVEFLDALTDESMMPAIPDAVPSGLRVFKGDPAHATH